MDEGRRRRVALGIVDEWESLKRILKAFGELDLRGFDASDALLLGLPKALGGELSEKLLAAEDRNAGMLPRVVIQDPESSTDNIDHGGGEDRLDGLSASRLSQFEDWLKPDLAADLRRQIDDGACLLIVPVENEAIERGVCRALLRFAADRVQAHDLHGV